MSKITETNQQYYQGAQPFLVTAAAGQTAFPTTFDTDLIFGSSDPTDIDYALNNFKLYKKFYGYKHFSIFACITLIFKPQLFCK